MMLKYTVKEDKLEEVKNAVKHFISEVKAHESDTLIYDAFHVKNNKNEFFHMMAFADEKAENDHRNTEHIDLLFDILYPNCLKKPELIELEQFSTKHTI